MKRVKLLFQVVALSVTLALSSGSLCSMQTVKVNAKQVSAAIKVGNTVKFGSYEQDGKVSNGKEPIAWNVLCVKDNKALLISKKGLDAKKFHETNEKVTWETCDLRRWLNDEFYNAAFSETEKNRIQITDVSIDDRDYIEENGEAFTKDKVFLLSEDEYYQYYSTTEMPSSIHDKWEGDYNCWHQYSYEYVILRRMYQGGKYYIDTKNTSIKSTPYARSRGVDYFNYKKMHKDSPDYYPDYFYKMYDKACGWWLRSTNWIYNTDEITDWTQEDISDKGYIQYLAYSVSYGGGAWSGDGVSDVMNSIRPVIWVEIQ